jgi:hypothetical protein
MRKKISGAASLVSVLLILAALTGLLTACAKNNIVGKWTLKEYDFNNAKSSTANFYVLNHNFYNFKKDGTCDAGSSAEDIDITFYWSYDKKNKNWRIAEEKEWLEREERWYETVEISGKNMTISHMKLKKK